MAKGDIRANIGARTKGTQMQWGKTGDKGVQGQRSTRSKGHKGKGAHRQEAKGHEGKWVQGQRGNKGKEETRP